MFQRVLNLNDTEGQSLFLWSARQTGKSTLLRKQFPDALWFDLLLSDVYRRLVNNGEQRAFPSVERVSCAFVGRKNI